MTLISAITFPDWISETAFSIPGTPISVKWYGIAYVVGIFLAYRWALRTVRQKHLWKPEGVTRGVEVIPNKMVLEDFTFYCLLGIMIGGRIGSLILYQPPETFLDIFKVWEGGMAFHGGFAGVCLAVWYISRKNNISLWRWADMAAIGAPLGLGLVRITNFMNQELWGRPTDVAWAFIFPKHDWTPRHPSQLYEAFLEGFVIFAVLWFLCRKKRALTKPGVCAGMFFLLYGAFRFGVEFVREPDASVFLAVTKNSGIRFMVDTSISNNLDIVFGLTRGMAYSLPMVIIGILILRWAIKRPPAAPKFMPEAEKPAKAK